MNELVFMKKDKPVTTSKRIAEVFGKEHKHVLRDIDELKKDVSNFGLMFFETTEPDSYGREQRIYQMNRDGFSLLAMGFTGSKAMEWKVKYIEAFNQMEETIENHIPQGKELLALAVLEAQKTIEDQTKQITEMKPKAIFADAVATSHTSILIFELAKILKQNGVEIGGNRLFNWMRENGYLIRRKGTDYNMPTQKSMELKLFEIKETTVTHADGHTNVSKTPKVTGKGQQYFINKFLASKAV